EDADVGRRRRLVLGDAAGGDDPDHGGDEEREWTAHGLHRGHHVPNGPCGKPTSIVAGAASFAGSGRYGLTVTPGNAFTAGSTVMVSPPPSPSTTSWSKVSGARIWTLAARPETMAPPAPSAATAITFRAAVALTVTTSWTPSPTPLPGMPARSRMT